MTSTKRSRFLSLLLISSLTLVSCAEEQRQTSRARYNSREECEREWGKNNDACYSSGGSHFSPYFLFLGGRGYYYPHVNGVPGNNPIAAPSSARFTAAGGLQGRGVVNPTGISRGGFGARGGFGGFGG